jgi:heme/copper-type cytochrome/quinol oxidase subunit 1
MRATRGRILRVKLGVNPNSSSLGTDIVFLALATPLAASLILAISALVRTLLRRKPDVQEEHLHP